MRKILTAEEQKTELHREKVAQEKGEAPVEPRDPPVAVKKRIIFLLIEEVKGKIAVATDLKTKMICLEKLWHSNVPTAHGATSIFVLDYYEEDEPRPTPQSPKYEVLNQTANRFHESSPPKSSDASSSRGDSLGSP